jgi:16S rRNA (cytidine1402-2'-O)-methyltransferase
MKGNLYLVSTPIGNLEDVTFRAIKILKEVDEIVCESTDKAKILLFHYQIEKPLIHLSDENQLQVVPYILEKILSGKNLALISDAGTPVISDPGFFLVKQAIKNGVKIIPIPGPSSILTALIASGLPTQPFLFLGFLPKKPSEKRKIFEELFSFKIQKEKLTIIFFESPQRLVETLEIIYQLSPNTQISIAREMTKVFEEFIRGKIDEVLESLRERKEIKGEVTVVLNFFS